jgi:hypothetical protein
MKKVVTFTAALLAFGASMAFAAGGLNLHFDGCAADGGASSAVFACNVNTGQEVLFASIVLPADMPKFLGSSAIVDVLVEAPSLPDWWRTAAGQCRANAISMSFDASILVTPNCADIWNSQPNLAVFQVQQFLHGPSSVRLNGGAAVPAGSEIALVADGVTELNVARVVINHTKTTGVGACDGCLAGACIVLQECYLQQPAGMPLYRLSTPISNVVTLNNGSLNCTGATPTQNRTWGAVKGLYR